MTHSFTVYDRAAKSGQRMKLNPVETTTVARKLVGSLGDLRRTAAFVRGTGVSIGVIDKKKKKNPAGSQILLR